jgi:hypothetical protein
VKHLQYLKREKNLPSAFIKFVGSGNSFWNVMKKIYSLILLSLISSVLLAQDFNGQWRGSFSETSYSFAGFGGNNIDYVLELQTSGSTVSGYSYTYFYEGKNKYYTICKLTGTIDRSTKEIVVTETERVKYNTPPDFQNCFQTHKLQYSKVSDDLETLKGSWMPAPNQSGNCGYGTTLLTRPIVKKVSFNKKPEEKKTVKIIPAKKQNTAIIKNTAPRKNTPPKKAPNYATETTKVKSQPTVTNNEAIAKGNVTILPETQSTEPANLPPDTKYEPRRKDILKTIAITQPTFRVDFYDNGEIDGDSITVFFNGKIILLHKMVSDKPITLNLSLNNNLKENIITMYADNLGTIPPNTALMIVTDGDKRYEVRMSSDTEKSGSVIFVPSQK